MAYCGICDTGIWGAGGIGALAESRACGSAGDIIIRAYSLGPCGAPGVTGAIGIKTPKSRRPLRSVQGRSEEWDPAAGQAVLMVKVLGFIFASLAWHQLLPK